MGSRLSEHWRKHAPRTVLLEHPAAIAAVAGGRRGQAVKGLGLHLGLRGQHQRRLACCQHGRQAQQRLPPVQAACLLLRGGARRHRRRPPAAAGTACPEGCAAAAAAGQLW